ncbi:hypothetical protein [Nocardia asiatica]|uniref:hypothetical protein n=1 Tax=Nocardia asiatica TaxID=209252 RepID=UPI0024579AB0|nr:hypothetical protein [Nocardia asiatica]
MPATEARPRAAWLPDNAMDDVPGHPNLPIHQAEDAEANSPSLITNRSREADVSRESSDAVTL